jgi:hypothetical protein
MASCSWGARFKVPLFFWWAVAFGIQVMADWLLKSGELRSSVRSAAIFVPAVCWITVIVLFVRAVLKLDELQQRIHVQAIALACVPTAILALLFSALDRAGIYRATVTEVGGLFLLLLVLGYGVSVWKYQ